MSHLDQFINAFGAVDGSRAAIIVLLAALSGFLLLYFFAAIITLLLTRGLLPALQIGAVVNQRPLRDSQIGREIARSLISVLVFGVYGLVTFLAWRVGLVSVDLHASWPKIVFEIVLLLAWNEVHFYCIHRLLHTRWLYRHVHRIHHESVAPTPFSTYSFHWLEAALLGSVMILPMLFFRFSLIALLALPVMSIAYNSIGHCNYNVFAKHPGLHSASLEHSMHHLRVNGNYGFYLPFLDTWANTTFRRTVR